MMGNSLVISFLHSSFSKQWQGMTYPYYYDLLDLVSLDGDVMGLSAVFDNQPAGLVLVNRIRNSTTNNIGKVADLLSIYVIPKFRHQHIARRLLQELDAHLRKLGYQFIRVRYAENQNNAKSMSALLKDAGYSQPYIRGYLYHIHRKKSQDFIVDNEKRISLPAAFRITPWQEVGEIAREYIRKHYEHIVLDQYHISPFFEEEKLELSVSLALWYGDLVVGWLLAHRMAPDTIRFSSLYVLEKLQPFGLSMPLLLASMRRCWEFFPVTEKIIFLSYVPKTIEFFNYRMASCMSQIKPLIERVKQLDIPENGGEA